MREAERDLSNPVFADQSRNKTAMMGIIILNMVLVLAYLLEFVKQSRTLGYFSLMAALCILPSILAIAVYSKKKESKAIRYILGIGFGITYAFVMFTSVTDLTFSYILVASAALIVYADYKFSLSISIFAVLVNAVLVIVRVVTTGLDAAQVANAEIMLICIFVTGLFNLFATKKIVMINQANTDKAQAEKEHSDKLLQTTLEVAGVVTENIGTATVETGQLNEAIHTTQHAMENLTRGTSDAARAIESQQQKTDEINDYIDEVESTTDKIVDEIGQAEECVSVGNVVMNSLLDQVRTSENSSKLVTKEMEELKEDAGKMQAVMSLISNVANQTGMLALNASIEAARAGEAGRGFAVVATEISSLASQTNSATGDINKLINNITSSIEEVVQAMNALLDSNRLQNEYVGQTAENFKKIHVATEAISSQAVTLKKTVEAVAVANKQVAQSVENVSALTEEVTASASETLESCNMNLKSIAKVTNIMEKLETEVEKLQQD